MRRRRRRKTGKRKNSGSAVSEFELLHKKVPVNSRGTSATWEARKKREKKKKKREDASFFSGKKELKGKHPERK